MPLAHLLGGLDPLALEAGRHPDIGDDHLGRGFLRPVDQSLVVTGHSDDLHVGSRPDQGPNALSDDQVVIGQEYGNLLCRHATLFEPPEADWSREAATSLAGMLPRGWRAGQPARPGTRRRLLSDQQIDCYGGGLSRANRVIRHITLVDPVGAD